VQPFNRKMLLRELGTRGIQGTTFDPECYTSGLEEAAYSGNVEVLKKLKPEAGRDNLEALLGQSNGELLPQPN